MPRPIAMLLALMAIAASFVPASTQAAPSATEAAALQRASERGRQIYAYDQAAWVSSDKAEEAIADIRTRVSGYVVEPAGDRLRAIFYLSTPEGPRSVFTADVQGRSIVTSHVVTPGEDASLSPLAVAMIRARTVASIEADKRRLAACSPARFNTVALPPAAPAGPIPVYLLTPQVKTGEFPFGGHYEMDVGADGTIKSFRAFTKSCLTLSSADPKLPDGAKPVGMVVTHLLDPTPTEIHVFLSLSMGQRVFVATGSNRVWEVDGDRIRLVEDPAK